MAKIKKGKEILKYIVAALFACILADMPVSAEAALQPFLKKENVQVEPNVLLLIDTSGSMVFKMGNNDFTYGDGTRPFFRNKNSKGIYYGQDNNLGTNVKNNNNDASVEFNYHPLLRFIPSKELQDAGINASTAEKYFAKRASTDPAKQSGESDFKYPNDSRMYVLKNVMYRILSDDTLVSNIRLALSTFHQSLSTWYDDEWGNYYRWELTKNKKSIWLDGIWKDIYGYAQGLHWSWNNGENWARLVENFKSTRDQAHLDHIKKWFDGEDDAEYRELRAHGATPLAASIYDSSNGSAKKFFQGKDAEGKDVASVQCQDNWLIVLTDGAESAGGNPAEAVRLLYELFKTPAKMPIKTFVIGMIDPNSDRDLAIELSKMADYGENGKLDQTYDKKWKVTDSKAYFPQDMQELFDAFRKIFYTIKEQSSTGGAPLATPSRSSTGDDSFYQAQYLPRNGKQWEGYLAKFAKNVAEDGKVTYPEKWEASDKLSKKNWSARKIYTAFNGLSGTDSNLYNFNDDDSSATALGNIMGIGAADAKNFIRWIRGLDVYDENNDESTTDERHKLFDIYHSGLVKVGPPAGMSANSLYRKFYTKYEDRATMIYVQSNAGMLHGFNDADDDEDSEETAGAERFAFIPPNVLAANRLRGLRWPDGGQNYDTSFSYPRYLADGPLIAEDVPIGSGEAKEYRTVLMAQLGLGGAGMYAVDVTKPKYPEFLWAIENSIYKLDNTNKVSLIDQEKDKNVLSWQKNGKSTTVSSFSHDNQNFPEGYDYRNLRLTVSTPFIGYLTTGEWAFVMGNGTVGELVENPKGEVFIGNIENGQILKKFQTSENSPIVSPVAVLNDGVYGLIRTFFVGDTAGKVFKADLSDRENKDNWTINTVLDVDAAVGLSYPLDATRVKNRLWIFVGTGDIEGYLPNQSFTSYFVAADITDVQPGSPLKRTDLESLSAEDAAAGLDPSMKNGWFITFKNPGGGKPVERMSTAPAVYNGYVFFSTFTPSDDPCKNTGTSKLYALEAATGIGGWKGSTKKYIELVDVKITGLSVSKGELVIGMTNFGESDLSDFRAIGDNLLLIDAPGAPGGGGESGIMKPLYWKSR